jgi:RimJ/RimL family protein N-acetyltransferase
MLVPPTLTTNRLHLRPFTLEDVPRLALLANDKRIADNVGFIHPYGAIDAEKFIRSISDHIEKDHGYSLAIVITESADLIGSIGFTMNAKNFCASFGYWIGVSFWGQGYMTEAARVFLNHLFTAHNLHRITATHNIQNPASGRVMKKIGMTHEATFRHNTCIDGMFIDDHHYAMLRPEWQALRSH